MAPPAAPAAAPLPASARPGSLGAFPARPRSVRAASGALAVVVRYALVAVPVVAGLVAWRGVSYWEYSDGVYALTARMLLGGAKLYGDVVAAQPPPLYYIAAGVLSVDDSLEALRAALALPLLATGLLVALTVWRLTRSQVAAVAGGLAALVTPWTLHEGTLLTPETFVAPLTMGAALLAGSRARVRWAGAVAALAATIKLAYLLPLLALGVASARRRAYAVGAAATLAGVWTILLATHGPVLIENVFEAQLQTGAQPPRRLAGLGLQAAWNLLPLVALAGLAWPLRHRARDARLLLSVTALGAGSAAVLLTLAKHGTYLNVAAVVEPPLVALGTCAVWWLFAPAEGLGQRTARSELGAQPQPTWSGSAVLAKTAAVLAIVLVAAQSASLLADPAHPAVFARPLSDAPHGRALSSEEVRQAARPLADCRPRRGARSTPFLDFVARQPIPGGQPDQFILGYAAVHAAARQRALLDGAVPPGCSPGRGARAARRARGGRGLSARPGSI